MTERHLTDEQLSARLDDLPMDERGVHLEQCRSCHQRLSALAAARDLVRTPVPALASRERAASIEAILRAVDLGEASPSGGPRSLVTVTRRRPTRLLAGAAAALVVAAIAVPVALSGSGTSAQSGSARAARTADSAASSSHHTTSSTSSAFSTATSQAPGGLGPGADEPVSDLGAVPSVAALLAPVRALESEAAAAPVTTPAPAGGVVPGATGEDSVLAPFASCLGAAAGAAGSGRAVTRLATATVRGTPALVFVFGPVSAGDGAGAGAGGMAVVTGRAGCRVLGTAGP
jgi:hypothetical protein